MQKNLLKNRQQFIIILIIISLSIILSFYSFRLFHISIQIYSIIISFIIFIIVLNTHQIIANNYYMFLGIVFGFIGAAEFIHTINFEGINSYLFLTSQMCSSIAFISRFTLALALMISFFFINKKVKLTKIISGVTIYFLICLGAVYYFNQPILKLLPPITINNFTLNNNYIIIFFLLVTLYMLNKRRLSFSKVHFNNMFGAVIFFLFSESFFLLSQYANNYTLVFAHLTRLLTFYFIYKSIVLTSLKEPYNTIFFKQIHLNRELNDLNHILKIVTKIHETINSNFELQNLFEKIVNILIQKEDYQMAFIGEYFKEKSQIKVRSSVGVSSDFLKEESLKMKKNNNAITKAVQSRKIVKDSNPQAVLNIFEKTDNNNHNSLIALPIYYDNIIYGVLAITSYKEHAFSKRVVDLLHKITQNLGLAITRDLTQKRIRYLSFHDQLTGLYNRNFFNEEIDRLDTTRKLPISIIISDFNDLKYINDNYGHKVGDEFLKTYAQILKNNSRQEDIIARWGGDEFVILLPNTDQQITENVIKRIREAVSEVKIEGETLSIACGYAIKDSQEQDIEEIFKIADDRMYQDKREIKNNYRENQI